MARLVLPCRFTEVDIATWQVPPCSIMEVDIVARRVPRYSFKEMGIATVFEIKHLFCCDSKLKIVHPTRFSCVQAYIMYKYTLK